MIGERSLPSTLGAARPALWACPVCGRQMRAGAAERCPVCELPARQAVASADRGVEPSGRPR